MGGLKFYFQGEGDCSHWIYGRPLIVYIITLFNCVVNVSEMIGSRKSVVTIAYVWSKDLKSHEIVFTDQTIFAIVVRLYLWCGNVFRLEGKPLL